MFYFYQDTTGDKFYVILDGAVEVYICQIPGDFSELKLAVKLVKGQSFGELALLHDQPRMAQILCVEDAKLLVLDKKAFNKVLRAKKAREMNLELDYFRRRPFLQGVRFSNIQDIYSQCSKKETYTRYKVVFKEGDEAQGMYVVRSG